MQHQGFAHQCWNRGRWLEEIVDVSTHDGVAQPMYEIPCCLYLFVEVAMDFLDPKVSVCNPSHSVKVRLLHQIAWAWTESIVTDCR